MKRLFILVSLIAAGAVFNPADAQVRVSINIGSQPAWGPVGYDYAEYYYLPEMDMYYYIPARQYIYLHGGRWIRSTYVPVHYRHIDFYRTYKVVINDRDPFRYHNRYRVQYARYRHRYDQPVLRDVRYRESNRGNNGWNNDRNRNNERWDNDRNRGNERWDNDRNRKDNNRGNEKWNNNHRGNDRSDSKRGNNGWNNGRGNDKREKDNRGNGRGRS